jgi:putative NADPH-quinone reductase
MNVLIIHAHPEPRSFNGALTRTAVRALREQGHAVDVSDLYAMKSADTYAPDGIDGAILDILWPIHNGILRYTGFDVLEPFITHMPGKISHNERRAVLDRYADEIRDPASRQRLFFHPRDDYGPDERLLPGVRPQSGFQHRKCG